MGFLFVLTCICFGLLCMEKLFSESFDRWLFVFKVAIVAFHRLELLFFGKIVAQSALFVILLLFLALNRFKTESFE